MARRLEAAGDRDLGNRHSRLKEKLAGAAQAEPQVVLAGRCVEALLKHALHLAEREARPLRQLDR
jgi:hypothetical protein